MKIYVIIPARSGSKGVPNKNIRKINGKELIGYSIEFAKRLQVDKIICSTDSAEYAEIAKKYGAEVPFLRSEYASSDTAKDEDVLKDVYDKFDEHNIEYPDLWVWLRPTFIFRDLDAVKECIDRMKKDKNLTACRIVTEAESRISPVEAIHLAMLTSRSLSSTIWLPSSHSVGESVETLANPARRMRVETSVF